MSEFPPRRSLHMVSSTSRVGFRRDIQLSPGTDPISPPASSPTKTSVQGIELEVDSAYLYDLDDNDSPVRTTFDLTALEDGSSSPEDLTKSIDYHLTPSPLTLNAIFSFRKFLTSPECMSPHPPLFRNHVKNYTLLYYAQSKTQLIYLIRSNFTSYPMQQTLSYHWIATVFSTKEEEHGYQVDAGEEEYGVDGQLLAEIKGYFERERRQKRPEWEELISNILKKLRGLEKVAFEKIAAEKAKIEEDKATWELTARTRSEIAENAQKKERFQVKEITKEKTEVESAITKDDNSTPTPNFKENIFTKGRPNLRRRKS